MYNLGDASRVADFVFSSVVPIQMKKAFFPHFVLVLIVTCTSPIFCQQVRLRSQLTPSCSVVASSNPNWKFSDITADGNIAVQGSYNCRGAFIYDITNPDAPVLANWYNPGGNQQFLEAIVIGNRAYLGSGLGNGGVHIVDLTDPYQPVLLGTVDSAHGNGNNVIHEMMVFDQGGRRYLIENYNSTVIDKSLKVIDVTNPISPVLKWQFSPADGSWVHAMHIRGNRMFMSEYTGLKVEIFDISNLATQAPTSIGAVVSNTTNHSSWTSEDGRYLYSARETQDGDLRVYDIQNPSAPVLVKSLRAADLNLNAITPHNPIVMGNKLYVSWYQAGVQVFDISTPTNPVRIGQYDTFQAMFAPPATESSLSLRESEPWDVICGAANLQNELPTNYDGNWTAYPFLGENKVIAGDLAAGLMILDVTGLNSAPKNVISDFDADRKTDFSVFNPTTGMWTIEVSSSGTQIPVSWGLSSDIPVAGDFDADGKSDTAVWRPSNGHWYVLNGNGEVSVKGWGLPGDIPVEGDYDADGKTDAAVWRPSEGTWYIWQSTLGIRIQPWGLDGDKPLVGDYDGDGKSDLCVWRPSNGTWYVLESSSSQLIIIQWGLNGDMPVVTDFDGNKRAEFTVFRPSNATWYQLDPFIGPVAIQSFGLSGDVPIPSDLDGDGKTDIAVFRPSTNTWYRIDTGDWAFRARTFGQSGDIPSPASAHPQ